MSDHPAAETLRRLAGTVIRGPNARVHFRPDADLVGLNDEVAWLQQLTGERLVCIGDLDDEHAILFQTNSGRCFAVSVIHPAAWFQGDSVDDLIDRTQKGDRGRPVLLRAQEEVMLYGEVFRRGDPRLYEP